MNSTKGAGKGHRLSVSPTSARSKNRKRAVAVAATKKMLGTSGTFVLNKDAKSAPAAKALATALASAEARLSQPAESIVATGPATPPQPVETAPPMPASPKPETAAATAAAATGATPTSSATTSANNDKHPAPAKKMHVTRKPTVTKTTLKLVKKKSKTAVAKVPLPACLPPPP